MALVSAWAEGTPSGLSASTAAASTPTMIRAEAQKGRTFLWYTTEVDELKNCDRAYVFRNGAIVAELASGLDDLVEDAVGVAEVLADHVPVRLLALTGELDQVDEHLLQVVAQCL